MKKKSVIIRITPEARKRIKMASVKLGYQSMISYIDDLSKSYPQRSLTK